jgi:D-glycero-alpha-D-manno-heptose-7-phosphate kinase
VIISRTPYRISFFGGGTDYPAWYAKHGGAVLAATIDKYCYLTCRYLPPFFDHKIRVVYSKIENCQSIDQISHPAIREVLRFMNFDRGVEIHHDGDLPARSGMGSSSSFTVGLLHALYALRGHMPNKRKLALESIHVEQELLKETVGSQDQVAVAYGGFNHIQFHAQGDISVTPVTIPADRLRDLNSHLMLLYTGIKRTASAIAGTYVNRMNDSKRQLRMMKDLVDEGLAILNSRQDLSAFGELLHEAWQAKKSLSPEITNPEVDAIYKQVRAAGACGGKLMGAGGGGFMLLFVPPDLQSTIRDRLNRFLCVPFKFESSGSQIIFFDSEQDYSHEEKIRANQSIPASKELRQAT